MQTKASRNRHRLRPDWCGFRHYAPLLALSLMPAIALAQQSPRSIVGTWASPGQGCTRADGALKIGPLSIDGEDVTCRFTSVSRRGNTVIWVGPCDDAEGSDRQTVTATETKGRLTLRYAPGGNVIENLRRCP